MSGKKKKIRYESNKPQAAALSSYVVCGVFVAVSAWV